MGAQGLEGFGLLAFTGLGPSFGAFCPGLVNQA